MGRFKDVEQRTDDDIADEPAGLLRIELAAASKARREAQAKAIRMENAALKARLAAIVSSTDDELDTEAAALARGEFAAKSQQRLREDQAAKRRHQREMEERIRAVGPRTDNSMDTEDAAVAREMLAAESKARQHAEKEERKRQNADMRARVRFAATRTDASLDTEAAGLAREELAVASQERYAREKEELKHWKAEMDQRIARAQDLQGSDIEAAALAELVSARELTRESDVHASRYILYKDFIEKSARGDEVRRDRKEYEAQKERDKAAQLKINQENYAQRKQQMEITRRTMKQQEQANWESARAVKAQEVAGEARKARQQARRFASAKERVAYARGLDEKLDKQEEAQDAFERQEASQMRSQMREDLRETREYLLSSRRHQTSWIKESTRQGLHTCTSQRLHEAAERAQRMREAAEEGRYRRQLAEEEYLQKAREHKAAAVASRATSKASREYLKEVNKAEADKLRNWAHVEWSFDSVAENISYRKQRVAAEYSRRYVNEEEAALWNNSPLKRLHDAARRAMVAAGDAIAGSFGASPPAKADAPAAAV